MTMLDDWLQPRSVNLRSQNFIEYSGTQQVAYNGRADNNEGEGKR